MREPTVSLIIPAFNEEAYIGKCLQSIETHAPNKFLEVIVVDNASTDRTGAVARGFTWAKVIREDHKGVMRARDRGCRESHGEIIAFIDSDCEIVAGWYERIVKEFAQNSNLALLSGPYNYYDISPWKKLLTEIYFVIAMVIYSLIGYMAIFGNMAIRREVLTKMSGLDTTIEFYGDDTNTARRAMQFGKVKFAWSFRIRSSGRRLKAQGLLGTPFTYVRNFLSEVFLHRQADQAYKDFR